MTEATPELLNQLVAEGVDYMHGKARKQVVEQLSSAKNTAETIGAITFKAAEGILSKYKDKGLDTEMDLAMGLATELIDMQLEILERVNPNVKETNTQRLREDSLLRTIVLYGESLGDDPEQKAQAQEMLAQLAQDGAVDEAFNYVNRRAAQEGLNVDDMIRQGNAMAKDFVGGGRRPVAAAVEQETQGAPLMSGGVPEPDAMVGGPPRPNEM